MVVLYTCASHLLQPVVTVPTIAIPTLEFLIREGKIAAQQGAVDVAVAILSGVVAQITVGKGINTQVGQVGRIHRLGTLGHTGNAQPAVVGNTSFLTGTFLGSNQHYTICTSRTIKGSSRGILQHFQMFHIVGIDAAESAKVVVHHHAVDHIDGVRTRVDGVDAANADASIVAWAGTGFYKHTRHAALQSLVYIGHRLFGQRLAIDVANSTRQVALLHDSANHDDLVQCGIVLFQDDCYRSRTAHPHFLGDKANVRDGEFVAFSSLHREVAVEVGHSTAGRARHDDAGTNNGFSRFVRHVARDGRLR